MFVPSGFIIPLFLASFLLLMIQYYRINPDRRLFNLQFGLLAGAVLLMFADVFMPRLSLVYFVLALLWFGITIYLMRSMPPPRT